MLLASGCSGALKIVFKALCSTKGQVTSSKRRNILIPNPGFPLYETLLESFGFEYKKYSLVSDPSKVPGSKCWDVDLEDLKRQVDENTVAVLLNNPSNPCGTVFSESHLKNILKVAREKGLIIVADEIYGDITFHPHHFHSVASLTNKEENLEVPVISVGGIAKEFLVPGFRLGWVLFYSCRQWKKQNQFGAASVREMTHIGNYMKQVKQSAMKLTQLILGPNSLIQAALPVLLDRENTKIVLYKKNLAMKIGAHAAFVTKRLNSIFLCEQADSHSSQKRRKTKEGTGWHPHDVVLPQKTKVFIVDPPQGSMYAFVKINPLLCKSLSAAKKKAEGVLEVEDESEEQVTKSRKRSVDEVSCETDTSAEEENQVSANVEHQSEDEGVEDISVWFMEKLLEKEQVFVLPGNVFGAKNCFRITLTPPKHILNDACDRIDKFVQDNF